MKKQTTKTAASKKSKKAKPAFKLDAKRAKKGDAIIDRLYEESDEEPGLIAQILALYAKGFEPREIVAMGYNRTTVYRQTGDLKRWQKMPSLEYYGHDLFELKVRRLIAKGMSREKAVKQLLPVEADEE